MRIAAKQWGKCQVGSGAVQVGAPSRHLGRFWLPPAADHRPSSSRPVMLKQNDESLLLGRQRPYSRARDGPKRAPETTTVQTLTQVRTVLDVSRHHMGLLHQRWYLFRGSRRDHLGAPCVMVMEPNFVLTASPRSKDVPDLGVEPDNEERDRRGQSDGHHGSDGASPVELIQR